MRWQLPCKHSFLSFHIVCTQHTYQRCYGTNRDIDTACDHYDCLSHCDDQKSRIGNEQVQEHLWFANPLSANITIPAAYITMNKRTVTIRRKLFPLIFIPGLFNDFFSLVISSFHCFICTFHFLACHKFLEYRAL